MFVRQDERRKEVRRLIQQVAALDVGDDRPRVPCMLWDVSAGGARLAPQQCAPGELPDKFFLLLAGGSVRRACQVKWRDERFAGVQFM